LNSFLGLLLYLKIVADFFYWSALLSNNRLAAVRIIAAHRGAVCRNRRSLSIAFLPFVMFDLPTEM